MLLEGSYLGDVEKVLESFRLIRREMIRGGEINVSTPTLPFIHFIDMELACLLSIESVIPDLTLSLLFPFIIFFPQINDRVLQNILVAATLPSYGLRSIEKYIEKRFPLVNIVLLLLSRSSFVLYTSVIFSSTQCTQL